MSVKHSLLALLSDADSNGYQLKQDFEDRTGGAWDLNVGQVYTTLQRLERDGLVVAVDDDGDGTDYRLTEAGSAVLDEWFATPVVAASPPRDELAIKVMIALGVRRVDLPDLLQRQRRAVLEQLQGYTRQKAAVDPARDLGYLLLLDALVLRAEADVRWLDMVETRLRDREVG